MKFTREYVRDGETIVVHVEHLEGARYRVRVGDSAYEYSANKMADGGLMLQRHEPDGLGRRQAAYGVGTALSCMVRLDGKTHALVAPSSRRASGGGGDADGTVRAPMTGTVMEVMCKPGDEVEADQTLVVVSAMKMEHKLAAHVKGTVVSVSTEKDATVDQGDELVVVEAKQE